MGYVLARVEEIGAELQALPKLESKTREVSKQQAVRVLARSIFALQRNGYTLQAIARLLSERGIDITAPTLGNYIRRLKERQPGKREGHRPPGTTPSAEGPRGTSGATPPTGAPREPTRTTPAKAAFAVREDTDDI